MRVWLCSGWLNSRQVGCPCSPRLWLGCGRFARSGAAAPFGRCWKDVGVSGAGLAAGAGGSRFARAAAGGRELGQRPEWAVVRCAVRVLARGVSRYLALLGCPCSPRLWLGCGRFALLGAAAPFGRCWKDVGVSGAGLAAAPEARFARAAAGGRELGQRPEGPYRVWAFGSRLHTLLSNNSKIRPAQPVVTRDSRCFGSTSGPLQKRRISRGG